MFKLNVEIRWFSTASKWFMHDLVYLSFAIQYQKKKKEKMLNYWKNFFTGSNCENRFSVTGSIF